ncbi:tandem C2 domains nuclear protein [Anguilla anguilla]|uniref:tandem C2 domains nuclear protein n=1 Tax=Anguilla anguilla TaxID=7936 RepID=UPI0015AC42A6|nr:tandem C2 domains nuclear protein [Anguilla anguilla]XP_035240224.1 tandem C2 domains nuclear protein [Anguilla anguilla]
MATECIKNCCKSFLRKEETETQVIKMRVVPASTTVSGVVSEGPRRVVGVSEDYLLSKLPPHGKEVPFVVPMFKPSYIQPSGSLYPSYQEGLHGSARCTYVDRKAELTGASHIVYDPCTTLHSSLTADHISPGSAQRLSPNRTGNTYGLVWDLKNGKHRLSNSMFDLTHPQGHMERYESVSSIQSSTSSMRDSPESSRSLESIALSGDEKEPGMMNVRLCYQEALEQIWITLVQCKNVHFPVDNGGLQKIGVKGVISLSKPVHFKSSVKEASPNTEFMETFVFALHLQQLHTASLVLRLQAHLPRKCTLGECVLSLRQLGPQETEHWLDITPPSRAPVCHAELHLATCFQPVSGRIQIQVLEAQNLPASSAPLSQSFFVKVEMHSFGRLVTKQKTRALRASGGQARWAETFPFPVATQERGVHISAKLYSRGSMRRKHFLGQVHLGYESLSREAVEQWRDTIALPEKAVAVWHRLSTS